jgi:predicted phage terminase large subunit-like protein
LQISRPEAARELLARRKARQGLLSFTEYTTLKWSAGKIHREICAQLDRVISGEIDRLMLLCPPQHGKSQITSRRFPAYVLGRDPTRDVISASATAELAEGFGRDVRNCIASQEYRNLFPATELAEDSQAKGRWNTKQGGSYYAVGIGGSLFGRGGLAVIDDPFASWEKAQSGLERKAVWEWYTGTLYNRIRPGQPIIVIQHRMHDEDLVGHLLEASKAGGDKWEVVELPADLDNPPWPERYDRAALERIKANTPARQWSALFMQRPTPDEGTYFLRKWFKRYRKGSEPEGLNKYASSDHAPSGNEDGDSNVFRMWGVSEHNDVYLLDGFKEQCTMDAFTARALPLIKRHGPLCWFPEDDNNWKAVAGFVTKQMRAQSTFCRIEPISPHGKDKITKAQAIQGIASMGQFYVPEGPEGDAIIEEYVGFPGAKHDDEVDAGAVLGRAIDQAHAGMMPRKDPQKPRDRWNDNDDDDNEPFNWKAA